MKKSVAFILVSVILMIGASIYFAIDINNKKMKEFVKDGYILTTENSGTTDKSVRYYFNSGTKYQEKYQDKVSFSDIDGEKVSLNNTSFVHYLDGSISTLKKGVVMDLDSINGSVVKYYNIFSKSLLEKRTDAYFVNNLGKQLKFSNFIAKTSENKYLIASDKITLFLSDNQAIDIKDYVEINFIEGEIIRLENQEVSYQTISSESYIQLANDVKLDLGTGNIYVKNEKKVSLNQMIIDSDDNIQIEPEEENEENIEQGGNEGSTLENGNSGQNGANGGVTGGTIGDNEEVVDENENTKIPVFSVTKLDVTANKIDADISITDDDSLLNDPVTLKVVENGTGKTVYMKEDNNGAFDINVLIENLTPETNYTLIASATYTKNNNDYTKEFVSKAFRTESLGIELNKNYYTTSQLSYLVKIDEYSQIKSATLILYDDAGKDLGKQSVDVDVAKTGQVITFDGLKSNTSYKVSLTEIVYHNAKYSNGYEINVNAKTLKVEPSFGRTNFKIDKRNSLFTLNYDKVVDTDNGIVSYRYEIYDARFINEDNPQAIKTIEKENNTSVDILVDNVNIFRGDPYVFRVVVEFYDNEKYVEYASPFSAIMQMDGEGFPTVNFEEELVTFERIKGKVIITDDDNTIDLSGDNKILVVYQNSLGQSTTITASGNVVVPIDINNLRANETYTISVYATVDLNDGNDKIDNCFIGSSIVKTEPTQPFAISLTAENEDVMQAFTVKGKLGASSGVDNELEASTLTGITFNLYEGKDTTQKLIRSIKKVDLNEEPYESTLKETYYDQEFELNPAFFGLANADLDNDYYTIEVTRAYDYTTYENEIPIEPEKDAVITVKTNGTIPDLPQDINSALVVNRILNKNAGTRYNAALDPNTIVGYEVQADYNNAKKYAQYLKYYVHDAVTGEIIESATQVYNVDASGEIGKVYFYLDNGTDFNIKDTELVRGNRYYFTYEAYLDMNGDTSVDLKWPTGSTVLSSQPVSPEKQAPKFQFYLASSSASSMTWKYTYSDIDNALISKNLSYSINGVSLGVVDIQETNTFEIVTMSGLSKGDFDIFTSVALIKTSGNISNKILAQQYFEGLYQMPQLTFNTRIDVNRLTISINDYENYLSYINRIAALKVTFSNGQKQIVKDNLVLDGDSVVIDLIDIAEFINQDVTVSVEAYFDTGKAGFEQDDTASNLYALQNTLIDGVGGEYYVINAKNNLVKYNYATASVFTKNFTGNTLTIKDKINNYEKTLDLNVLETGVEYNYENISLKKLETLPLGGDGTQNINFDMIIAGVSLLDENGKLNIASSLQDAEVKINLYGAGASAILNNKIYLKLFEFDEDTNTSKEVRTVELSTTELNKTITIPDLLPKTNYYITLHAEVYNGTGYEMVQLYDIDTKSANERYNFSTLYSVGISNINVAYDYENATYSSKNLALTYNLEETIGFNRIEYNLYKIVKVDGVETRELVNLDITSDKIFKKNMKHLIPCNPGGAIEFGYDYEIELTSIAEVTINNQKEDRVLDEKITYRFTLDSLRNPFVGVSSNSSVEDGNYKIEYKVNIFDMDKVIVDGVYKVRIFDEDNNDITPDKYANKEYDIKDLNASFVIENLKVNTTYKLQITTYNDMDNSGIDFMKSQKSFDASTVNDYGIDIGTVYASANSLNRAKIDLTFYNSYRLDWIDEVRYSIYGQNGYSIDGKMDFTPVQVSSNQGYYYTFTLDKSLPTTGIYNIEMQFIYNGIIIKQISLEHSYTD